jgi:hypothetical protein
VLEGLAGFKAQKRPIPVGVGPYRTTTRKYNPKGLVMLRHGKRVLEGSAGFGAQ